jgi:hypothetical protein
VFLLNLSAAGREEGLKKLAQELGHSQRSLVAEPSAGAELYVIPKCEQAKILMAHGKLERGLLGVLIVRTTKGTAVKRHRDPDVSVAAEAPASKHHAPATHLQQNSAATVGSLKPSPAAAVPAAPLVARNQPPPPPGAPPPPAVPAAGAPQSDDQMAAMLANLLAGGDTSALAGAGPSCLQHRLPPKPLSGNRFGVQLDIRASTGIHPLSSALWTANRCRSGVQGDRAIARRRRRRSGSAHRHCASSATTAATGPAGVGAAPAAAPTGGRRRRHKWASWLAERQQVTAGAASSAAGTATTRIASQRQCWPEPQPAKWRIHHGCAWRPRRRRDGSSSPTRVHTRPSWRHVWRTGAKRLSAERATTTGERDASAGLGSAGGRSSSTGRAATWRLERRAAAWRAAAWRAAAWRAAPAGVAPSTAGPAVRTAMVELVYPVHSSGAQTK